MPRWKRGRWPRGIIHRGFSLFCPLTAISTAPIPAPPREPNIFTAAPVYTNSGPARSRFPIPRNWRNGRGINSLYYRTEERQEAEWMSDGRAFVGGERARTYGALFRPRPGGRCDAKKRRKGEKYPRIRPVFKSFRASRRNVQR